MTVKVYLKDEVVEIANVHFYSFERNFLCVNCQTPTKSKTYFKLGTVLKLEETNQ